MGVGAPSGVDGKWSEGLFRSVQDRDDRDDEIAGLESKVG